MIEVLFEDQDLLIINKPAGLLSQATPDPKRITLLSELAKQFPNLKLVLHHRLDKDTSGIMLLGKSVRSNKPLTDLFRDHQIQKTYILLCKTEKKSPEKFFNVSNHMAPVRSNGKQISRMVVVKSGGWSAETDFETLELFTDMALVKALPKTGRTHQIRVHIAHLKMPIVGDHLYGGKSTLVPRLMLHAHQLNFVHPFTQKEVVFECGLPKDMETILKKLREVSKLRLGSA